MCIKLTKGAMQGTLADIGRHGDLEIKISTNLKKGVMQGETSRVIK